MTSLRRIEALQFPDVAPAVVAGKRPELRWLAPTDLYVDGTYQRDLSRKSLALIRTIYRSFAWNRVKPPIVVDESGRYHVIDGQHTAIAAASLSLPELPCFIIEACALDERARAFGGHNTDRIAVSGIAIYNALRAAGDPDALDVERVCARAGVRIREFTQSCVLAEGDTKAIGLIRKLIRKHGVIKARKVLECLAKARLAPIPGCAIQAAENIICIERPEVDLAGLTAVIRADGEDGIAKARAKASGERSPTWRALMARWLRRIDREGSAT
jgi:hypothetical protein